MFYDGFYLQRRDFGPGEDRNEASGEAWAEYADAIYTAHGGQHPDDPPAEEPAS